MKQRITIDPVTRIEGHLRIDVEVEDGRVAKSWASGQMWRGIENIVVDRDPRDAWAIVQRICGVCTTVHAMASVRAVENALKLEVPLNAQYIRNMMLSAHSLQDHIVHFYQLSALDWVDVVSATKANPVKAAQFAEKISDWEGNSPAAMEDTQNRLREFVGSGQLGVFANGYWGHPAMRLSPEVNLMAVSHYLQALEAQRWANKIVGTLGSKTPHIQNLAVGGVANPIATDSEGVLTIERLMQIKEYIDKLGSFIHNCYFVDVAAIAGSYPEWLSIGAGVNDFLSTPDLPLDTLGTRFMMPGGYIPGGNLRAFKPISHFGDTYFTDGVAESVKHSWYTYKDGDAALNPWKGETTPSYTDFQDDGKYSWIKSPTFEGRPAQVGPIASVMAGIAAGDKTTLAWVNHMGERVRSISGHSITPSALNSTMGRHAARVIRACVMYEALKSNWQMLIDNIGRGDMTTFNKPVFPSGEIMGVGQHEAPRGLLSHWVVIKKGRIANYQAVVPSTWLAAPKNDNGHLSSYEVALMGSPVADPQRPLEPLRTIHSFDPCLACAVHLTDMENNTAVSVQAL
ncbi:MAG: nickel-dependent hydrogenase large subunit [Acidobacteriaceae bacterium]|nr:nickel-dependent hydrogenase large subunit [Acidobacteriaceae bacterium]